jgi:hypothetical protein
MRSWERAKLRKAAIRYVEHGWHVLPGAYLVGQHAGRHAKERRFDCGEVGCRTVACHPVPGRAYLPTRSPAVVDEWWRTHPYSVLFPTGHAFDVLEVSATLGRAALLGDGFVAARGPVAVAQPKGQGDRWFFLVLPGHGLLPELAQQPDVVLHGQGSWVPAAPSPQFGGRVRWELSPETHGWRPAEPYAVQALMLDAIGAGPLAAAGPRATWRSAA